MHDVNMAISPNCPSSEDKGVTGDVGQIARSGSRNLFPGFQGQFEN